MYDLLDFKSNLHNSQFCDDGIIQKIFDVIGTNNKYCVEFGAWDGSYFSNTWYLIHKQDWGGFQDEIDTNRYAELVKCYEGNPKVSTGSFTIGRDHPLDVVLAQVGAPKDLDFMVIDVDGNDYHIWRAMNDYRPRVIMIECNGTIPWHMEVVQRENLESPLGSSALAMYKLGKAKGYRMVCYNVVNAFFVVEEEAHKFDLKNWTFPYLFHRGGVQHHYGSLFMNYGQMVYSWHEFDCNEVTVHTRAEFREAQQTEIFHVLTPDEVKELYEAEPR